MDQLQFANSDDSGSGSSDLDVTDVGSLAELQTRLVTSDAHNVDAT
jgi:hypothetical protein